MQSSHERQNPSSLEAIVSVSLVAVQTQIVLCPQLPAGDTVSSLPLYPPRDGCETAGKQRNQHAGSCAKSAARERTCSDCVLYSGNMVCKHSVILRWAMHVLWTFHHEQTRILEFQSVQTRLFLRRLVERGSMSRCAHPI